MCANLVTNYKKHLTFVLTNKGFPTKYEGMFNFGIKYLFHLLKCKSKSNCTNKNQQGSSNYFPHCMYYHTIFKYD